MSYLRVEEAKALIQSQSVDNESMTSNYQAGLMEALQSPEAAGIMKFE